MMRSLRIATNKLAMTCDTLGSNRKVGRAATTYATQDTCLASCPLLGEGCYAETGMVAYTTRRYDLAKRTNKIDWYKQIEAAETEAAMIDKLDKPVPLRLHVVGDSPTVDTTIILAEAAQRYIERHKQPVWTYTHAWRIVPREVWGPVSVLASCEGSLEPREAAGNGYSAAILVPEHTGALAKRESGLLRVPCPAQTGRAATCTDCRLCFDADALFKRKAAITFAAHGARQRKIRGRLNA